MAAFQPISNFPPVARSIDMLRSPSIVTSYRNQDSSSPDPLATSFHDDHTIERVVSTTRPSSPSKRRAPVTKSPRKASGTFHFDPSAIVSEQNASPWKIRVTVEAESENQEMEDAVARTRTRTIKVPLREESSPVDAVKTSARGRKANTASGSNRRSATPRGGGRDGSRRRRSVTDLDARPLGDDADEDDWLKQKKSPRKRKSSRSRKGTPVAVNAVQLPSSPLTRSKRKANFAIRQDADAEEGDDIFQQEEAVAASDSPELRSIDLNRVSVRPRAYSTKSRADDGHGGQGDTSRLVPVPPHVEVRKVSVNSAMSYPTPSPTSSYHGDSDGGGNALAADPAGHDGEGFDTIIESEGFTMIDLDTLPTVRRYLSSPLDVDGQDLSALVKEASGGMGGASATASEKSEGSSGTRQSAQTDAVSLPAPTVDDSDISSTVPSSPPTLEQEKSLLQVPSSSSTGNLRKVTPMIYSSPKLPSPPKQVVRQVPHHQHRGSASAVFAGIALQEVLSPDRPYGQAAAQEKQLSLHTCLRSQDAGLFEGFDSGTKRELRAGLRFGEELAKRQSPNLQKETADADHVARIPHEQGAPAESAAAQSRPNTRSRSQTRTQVWRGETLVQRTPVLVSHGTGRNTMEADQHNYQTPLNTSGKRDARIPDTQARREREWQLEREAVSRQIQNASESQVIVIDSEADDDREEEMRSTYTDRAQPSQPLDAPENNGEDEEEDIWLAEARNSSSPVPDSRPSSQPPDNKSPTADGEGAQEAQPDQGVSYKPRRSLIPSPWKRGDALPAPPEHSTFLSTVADEMSGLMCWQEQESKIKFGAGEIKRQRLRQRRSSGTFDVDLMLGTPKSEDIEDETIEPTSTSFKDEDDPEHSTVTITAAHGDESLAHLDSTNESRQTVDPSSPQQPIKIAINFNDSIAATTPPSQVEDLQSTPPDSSVETPSSPQQPPTPRSALKGSRSSLGLSVGGERPDTPTMIRRVVWSERSRGVDVDGQESSFSMRSGSDESDSRDFGSRLTAASQLQEYEEEDEDEDEDEVASEQDSEDDPEIEVEVKAPTAQPSKGWGSWFWGSRQDASDGSQQRADAEHGSSTLPSPEQNDQPATSQWEKTKSSIASSNKRSRPSSANPPNLPSYLLPPSYPSDPLRASSSTVTPLALGGAFTNQHFRTLHIIYRKSLRPKFHAPPTSTIRREILALKGSEMEIDESGHGIDRGVFCWKMGHGECEVLERFMQECELSHGWFKGRRIRSAGQTEGEKSTKPLKWEWSVEQLAEWLCRIVVGEVVREEEVKAVPRV